MILRDRLRIWMAAPPFSCAKQDLHRPNYGEFGHGSPRRLFLSAEFHGDKIRDAPITWGFAQHRLIFDEFT